MYLSRLILNPRSRAVWRDLADCHDLHRTVMSGFVGHQPLEDPRATLGVLHRLEVDHRSGRIALLVQSAVAPDWSRLEPGYLLEPEAGAENPACKEVGEKYESLRAGAILAFRLHANPTKKIDTKTGPDGRRRNGRRVELRDESAQSEWLSAKGAKGGFRLLSVRASPWHAGAGPGDGKLVGNRVSANSTRITFGSVLFEGELVVTDADLFLETLKQGVGSGKAYGFGLLSVAPPGLVSGRCR